MTKPIAARALASWLRCRLVCIVADSSGATAIEYGLIAGLIGIAIVGGVTTFGSSLSGQWIYVAGIVNPKLNQ